VIVVPTGTPQSGPALQHCAATAAQPSAWLGRVLAVIATAQHMVSLDLPIVNQNG
jgi:hypothetical protein